MGEKIIPFAEEATQVRLMETALNGTASEVAIKAEGTNLHPLQILKLCQNGAVWHPKWEYLLSSGVFSLYFFLNTICKVLLSGGNHGSEVHYRKDCTII